MLVLSLGAFVFVVHSYVNEILEIERLKITIFCFKIFLPFDRATSSAAT